jgi:hypothetical protein
MEEVERFDSITLDDLAEGKTIGLLNHRPCA